MILNMRTHRPLIEMAAAVIPDLDDRYSDQTALNDVWQTLGTAQAITL